MQILPIRLRSSTKTEKAKVSLFRLMLNRPSATPARCATSSSSIFGRNSYDDNDQDGPKGGAPLESYVRYGTVRNAYWCPSKSYYCPKQNVMVFGPGYAGAIDIVAHEMVHGIIQHEANLIYSDEPGAVNESIADIFGALIEFYAKVRLRQLAAR